MYKYCAKCGAEVEQTSAFCFACGTLITEENPALDEPPVILQPQPVPEPEASPEMVVAPDAPPEQPKKRKLRKPLWIAILAVAVVVAAVIAWQVLDTSYEDALKTYVAVCNGDLNKVQQLAPAEYWETMAGENGTAMDAIKEERKAQESRDNSYTQLLGEDMQFTAKCVHSEPAEAESMEKLRTLLEEKYGISPEKVKEAVLLEVYTRWEGSLEEMSNLDKFCAVKIGTQWYIGHYFEGEKSVYFRFPTQVMLFSEVIG